MAEDEVEVAVEIAARPETVFRCVTRSDLLSTWLAAKASIEPRLGGAVRIDFERYATVVEGEVVELVANERVAFTWGVTQGAQAADMPRGSTRVTITLTPSAVGTRVVLRHAGLPGEASRRDHSFGWTSYLGQLASVAPRSQHPAGFEGVVDAYLAAWAESDAAARGRLLASSFAESGTFKDVHADLAGRAALDAHIALCLRMFPGVRLVRDGAVMQSRASLLARWNAVGPSGTAATGFNVFRLDGDGKIADVEGFWAV
jgi:uncharacterized protein YndB with AHSA1/START domain